MSVVHDALLSEQRGEKVACLLCPNLCVISEGGRGICGARGVVGGRLRALTYGLVSSAVADPIEKKPVFHFCPGTSVFSLGSVGCSMRCGHCQNWQISRPKGDDGSVALRYVDPATIVDLVKQTGSSGVAFTYNEPTIWLEYVLDAAKPVKEAGMYTIMVTNGYVTEAALDLFAEVIDVWRVDIKGFEDATYKRLCHVPHAEQVRRQAERAKHHHGMHVECVTNIVPTINDSEAEITGVAQWIAESLGPDTPWHVTRFMPYLEFSHLDPTPIATLERAREIGRAAGLHYVFLGNVNVPGGEDTVCPSCGQVAVARTGFSILRTNLTPEGQCGNCGADLGIRCTAKSG